MNHKYLLIKGIEGFGNRILSALTGILYAELTGRKYIIDWRDDSYSDNGKNVFHDFFDSPIYKTSDTIPETACFHPPVWNKNRDKSIIDIFSTVQSTRPRSSSVDIRKLDYEHDVLVLWMCTPEIYLLRRHFKDNFKMYKDLNDEEIFRKVYKENFILKPAIALMVNNFKEQNFGPDSTVIGIHVRYTDKKIDLYRVLRIIENIQEKEKNTKIFLSTDNKEIINIFRDKKDNIITTNKWFPKKNGSAIHKSLDCPSKIQNGIEALMDMYLLAECDYLVYASNSTFAYISNLISDMPQEHKFNIYKKKLKEYVPKVARRYVWEFLEDVRGIPRCV